MAGRVAGIKNGFLVEGWEKLGVYDWCSRKIVLDTGHQYESFGSSK